MPETPARRACVADRPAAATPLRRVRRLSLVVLALVGVVGIVPEAGAGATTAAPAVAAIHLEGRGHGHGVGMDQWGAFTLASGGATAAEILSRFYPGTALGTAGGEVPVVVQQASRVRVALPEGGELRSDRGGPQAPGFPIPLAPGEVVEIVHDGTGYRVLRGEVQAVSTTRQRYSPAQQTCPLGILCPPPAAPPPTDPPPTDPPSTDPPSTDPPGQEPPAPSTTAPPSADGPQNAPEGTPPPATPPTAPEAPRSPTPIWAIPTSGTVQAVDRGRAYRGIAEVVGSPGALRLRNHVDIEDYLRGMGEVPGSWPAAAVQAQTVAARTYALRAVAGGGEICDTASCQVYVGVGAETPGQAAATEATRGQVVTFGGGLAATFYSASSGGFSANIQEGFGSVGDIAYLPARPVETVRPDPWSLDISLDDVAARLGYPGRVTAVEVVDAGPSGRPVAMALEGDAGTMDVDPQVFRRRLGLRSTFFAVDPVDTATAPPPPPAPVEDQLGTFDQDRFDPDAGSPAGRIAPSLGVAGILDGIFDLDAGDLDVEETAARLPLGAGASRDQTIAAALALLALAAVTAMAVAHTSPAPTADGLGSGYLGAPALLALPHRTPRSSPARPAATMAPWRTEQTTNPMAPPKP